MDETGWIGRKLYKVLEYGFVSAVPFCLSIPKSESESESTHMNFTLDNTFIPDAPIPTVDSLLTTTEVEGIVRDLFPETYIPIHTDASSGEIIPPQSDGIEPASEPIASTAAPAVPTEQVVPVAQVSKERVIGKREARRIDAVVNRVVARFKHVWDHSLLWPGVEKFRVSTERLLDDLSHYSEVDSPENRVVAKSLYNEVGIHQMEWSYIRSAITTLMDGRDTPGIRQKKIIQSMIDNPGMLRSFLSAVPAGWKIKGSRRDHKDTMGIVIPVEDFELEDAGLKIPFTGLKMTILIPTSGREMIYVKVTGNAKAGTDPQYIHPHVARGEICYGDMGVIREMAARSWDIPMLYQVALSVLRSYHRTGAYKILDSWAEGKGGRCGDPSCRKWHSIEEVKTFTKCPRCGRMWCPECVEKSQQQQQVVEEEVCSVCNPTPSRPTTPEASSWICLTCRQTVRPRVFTCVTCGKLFCLTHMSKYFQTKCCSSPDCSGCRAHRKCQACAT